VSPYYIGSVAPDVRPGKKVTITEPFAVALESEVKVVNKDLQMQLEQLKKRNPITEPIKRRLLPWKITIILAGLALDAWTILKVFGKI
jgi:hypothetical protein